MRLPLLVLLASLTAPLAAQPARTLPLDDEAYRLIERLQRRGVLLGLHPTALPYTEAEVQAALADVPLGRLRDHEADWLRTLERRIRPARPDPDQLALRADISVVPSFSTSGRLDPLRPLDGDPTIPVGGVNVFPDADAHVTLGTDRMVAQLGLQHSVFANDDPDGLDVVNRLMVRNEEGYVAYRSPRADLALGRIATHWGRFDRDALFLSDNARPFDALHIRLGGPRLSLRSVLGELDAANADGTFDGRAGDDPSAEPRINRYLAAHRFDWRPSRAVALTVSESAIYSGANAGPSLAYLLPTQGFAFFIDNVPKNVENNGTVGGALWVYHRGWTLNGELYLDDFDVLNGNEPTAAALTGTLGRAEVLPRLDAEFGLTAVTARAYNATQREGLFTYALRGLGTEFNDYVRARLSADWYPIDGLTVSPDVEALWQGERSIETPYPDNDVRTILTGEVARTLRIGSELRYLRDPRWWAGVDLGVNLNDAADVPGAEFSGLVTLGLRLSTAGAVRAGL